jgi:hypothetical protein
MWLYLLRRSKKSGVTEGSGYTKSGGAPEIAKDFIYVKKFRLNLVCFVRNTALINSHALGL